MIGAATPLQDILEHEWQRDVENLAKTLGWKTWHNYNARRSDFGWPDLFLARERTIHIELKREKGKLTDPQKEWLRALLDAGAEAYVARPRDLDALALILAGRESSPQTRWRLAARDLRERTRQEAA